MTTIEAIQMNIHEEKKALINAYKMPENNDMEVMFKLSAIDYCINKLNESKQCLQYAINQVNNQ